jgi:hypothetical protein
MFSIVFLLAHLSQSDRVSFCDRFSSGVRPSVLRHKTFTLNDISS